MKADGDNHDCGSHAKFWDLTPVAPERTGQGLPYAPENWPKPGDVWGWRTGRRVSLTGHFLDRYLYLPSRLCRPEKPGSSRKQKQGFASKLSVERYIKDSFPHVDLLDFFASFSWKIPALHSGNVEPIAVPLQQLALSNQSDSDLLSDNVGCRAGNQMCSSLILEQQEKYSPFMHCDICCMEPGFCCDCCCILCCKTVNSADGGYNYIKCQVKIGDDICGHVAHLECALRCHMAGTVGGSIGLDAEYYCRRCDGRTDLVSHVKGILQKSEAMDLEDDIEEKILNLGVRLLCGSEKAIAKELLSHIELAISKLKCGTNRNVDDNPTAHSASFLDNDNAVMDVTNNESPVDVRIGTETFGCLSDSLKLELEIDQVLQTLGKSQQLEYNIAEERLHAHRNYLQNLYQQLEIEKSELACQQHASRLDVLFRAVTERKEQIRQGFMKLEDMKKVANGFGRTSKDILKEYFGLEIAD